MKELIDTAKAEPGTLSYGSTGSGSAQIEKWGKVVKESGAKVE